jgi:hypothetical protein
MIPVNRIDPVSVALGDRWHDDDQTEKMSAAAHHQEKKVSRIRR